MITRFFTGPCPRVFAHRGLALGVTENTMIAFELAVAAGVEYLETDVYATADGVAVLSHDADLRRLLGRPERIDRLEFATLNRLDLGNSQGFVRLSEALTHFPNIRFNIDIKSDAAVEPTIAAIVTADARDRVLVTSFHDLRRRRAVRALPGVATSASVVTSAAALLAARLGSRSMTRRVLRDVHALQIPETFGGIPLFTRRIVALLQQSGVEVHVWTINDPQDMVRLLELGIDGLVTDRADLALQVLRKRASSRE